MREHGISQFLDIGSGLPTASNVHEVAQEADPRSRVAYVDNDHIVAAHARALLLFAVLHFLTDADDPYGTVRAPAALLAPGSVLAVSHVSGDETDPARSLAAQQVYQGASAPAVPRACTGRGGQLRARLMADGAPMPGDAAPAAGTRPRQGTHDHPPRGGADTERRRVLL